MKKICIMLSLFALVVLAMWIYKFHKTCYLNLKFTCLSGETEMSWGEVEVSRMEISPGIALKGYPEAEQFTTTAITDRQDTNKVIDYLNSIPLTYVRKGENFNDQGGGSMYFFDEDGHDLGRVSINNDNYIHDSRTVTTYKPQNKDTVIISCLENLDLKK